MSDIGEWRSDFIGKLGVSGERVVWAGTWPNQAGGVQSPLRGNVLDMFAEKEGGQCRMGREDAGKTAAAEIRGGGRPLWAVMRATGLHPRFHSECDGKLLEESGSAGVGCGWTFSKVM